MSAAAAIAHTYAYAFPSAVGRDDDRWDLRLATSGGAARNPYFFDGRVHRPREFGAMLLGVSATVMSRFFTPRNVSWAELLDPVVTSSDEVLRFEGFSGCCSVYVRADLLTEAFDSDVLARGTTNVDFNTPMRGALGRLKHGEEVCFAVGADEVRLTTSAGSTSERKVKLPRRWLKSFVEVQAYQAALEPAFDVPAVEALPFVRTVPRAETRRPSWVVRTRTGLRLTKRETPGGVRLAGERRVRLIEPLLAGAERLRVRADAATGTSCWEVEHATGRVSFLVSPEETRGFSGEGQVLETLAADDLEHAVRRVRAALAWQSRIDPCDIEKRHALSTSEVDCALAALGSRGLVGYDAARSAYFHRELPFDVEKVVDLHPRLRNARALVAEDGVRPLGNGAYHVRGTDVTHTVQLHGDTATCTCPWFAKHQGQRGPCKHVLAARIHDDDA